MKFTCLKESLAKYLTIVSRNVSTKATLPVLSNIYLQAKDGRIKMAATNLDTGVTVWIGAKVEKEGELTIPAKQFQEFINSLPAEKIEFKAEDQKLYITCGHYSAVIHGIVASEFPPIPTSEEKPTIKIAAKEFLKAVNQVAYAAATDEGRPVLTGVSCLFSDGKLSLAATDGYRLSVKELGIGKLEKTPSSLILPAKSLLEAAHIVQDVEGSAEEIAITVTPKSNQVIFSLKEVELVTRLIEGQFPDYQKIIPTSHTTTATIDTEEFLHAVKVASIFARDSANVAKLQFQKDGHPIQLMANSAQVGENKTIMDAAVEGEENEIAFNTRYLIDFLGSITDKQVHFEMSGPKKAALFKPIKDETLLHIIMPIRVSE